MKYCFDLKTQLIYGVLGFILAVVIIYFLLGRVDWINAVIVGVANFFIAGFYKDLSKKKWWN